MDDVEAIKRLKARYFRTMDTKDWEGMWRILADEVVIDTVEAGGSCVTGADAFMAFLQEALADAVTVHHGHAGDRRDVSDHGLRHLGAA